MTRAAVMVASPLARMQVLDLQANSLTGHLPHTLCHSGSRLEMLQVRNNRLSGYLTPLAACSALTQLDVSGNNFTGGLSDVKPGNLSRLVVLDASHNKLTGSIPPAVYHLPVLSYLSLSHNRWAACHPCHCRNADCASHVCSASVFKRRCCLVQLRSCIMSSAARVALCALGRQHSGCCICISTQTLLVCARVLQAVWQHQPRRGPAHLPLAPQAEQQPPQWVLGGWVVDAAAAAER